MSTKRSILVLVLLMMMSLLASACSNTPYPTGNRKDGKPALNDSSSTVDDLLAFDGSVFVASTRPLHHLWQAAGWRIAAQPADGGEGSIPVDCTLYPHQGVDDQWIGSCSGRTYIPRAGASHIAVMHTNLAGSTQMVQVAPPPVSNDP